MCFVSLFDYCPDGKTRSAIRATEGLVESRIPPRKAIRENCPLEFPHIMLLIDDPRRTVIEPLKGKGQVVYDGVLNSGGGKVTDYNITDTSGVTSALDSLYDESTSKYGELLLLLVSDGNHSLATAKACVEENNPLSRYALVEVVNVYDEGLLFKPIHRVIYGADNADFVSILKEKLSSESGKATIYMGDKAEEITFPTEPIDGFKKVQTVIDECVKSNGGEVDYIHVDEELRAICVLLEVQSELKCRQSIKARSSSIS